VFAAGVYGQGAESPAAKPGDPTDSKARKTYAGSIDFEHHDMKFAAIDEFRKANKQDGGHCMNCLERAFKLAFDMGDYKTAEAVIEDELPMMKAATDQATLHMRLAMILQSQGIHDKKDKCFNDSCQEFKTALALDPNNAGLHYGMGVSLAWLHQDDAARDEFKTFLTKDTSNQSLHERAQRYADRVELARSRMAPPFTATTIDGQRISLDSLTGKVVLIDFWATWCGPCREALPHIKQIAHRFEGQPLVVISVSLDDDEAKWKEFVAKNQMTWLQTRDGGFTALIAREFHVDAIPSTFTIDADGVLEDQHVGDADIEGKLKKLIAHAQEQANRKNAEPAAVKPQGAGN
jgi:thiol-disulfide isomerase/thioredoxin